MITVKKLSTNCSRCNHKIAHTLNYLRILRVGAILVLCLVQLSLVRPVLGGINYNEFLAQLKVPQCRKDCVDKFSADDLACLQKLDCSICDFPPYQFHNFPDAVNLMCWSNCAPRTSVTSVVDHHHLKSETTKSSDTFEVSVHSMVRDKSLTMANIVWYANDNGQHQCLVNWEIFGSGIVGNLLTDTHEAELSLWPDSKYQIEVTCKNKNTNKMSKSLPILIDTSATTTPATITTSTVKSAEPKRRRPEALIASMGHTNDIELGKDVTEKDGPPSSLQPHSNQATKVVTTKPTPIQAYKSRDNNHRQHDETEAIASITRQLNDQKQHEYNNDYQITAKPLYDAQHQMSMHDGIVVEKATGKNDDNDDDNDDDDVDNGKMNSVHGTLTTSRDAAKLSKSLPSNAAKITHTHIETVLTVLCILVFAVTLVICMVVSLRQHLKSNMHCDKTNLISSSASCSSTTSINDCEMDFNGSTTSIASMTAIHV